MLRPAQSLPEQWILGGGQETYIHTQKKLISQWHHEEKSRVADLLQKKDSETQSGKINKSRKSQNGGAGC